MSNSATPKTKSGKTLDFTKAMNSMTQTATKPTSDFQVAGKTQNKL
jgi:hypothetical protein